MIIVHTGFDGLDIALKTTAPPELIAKLEEAKAFASESHSETLVRHNGIQFHVAETGGNGGYAYRFNTGSDGAIWFVKKPKKGDPWGVRVSFHSKGLAFKGLEATRAELDQTCAAFGLQIPPDGVSIGRVDFAVDIFAPNFNLDPKDFVMHARSQRKTFSDLSEMQTHGPSGRFTSVTIGKQPGRQVIVYDKREDVLAKRKVEWPMIWNTNLEGMGLPYLDPTARDKSQVWRIELRLGKKALRERANIRGWETFYKFLQAEFDKLAQDVTLHCPSDDSNRSRWPMHPMWSMVQEAIATKLFAHEVSVPLDGVRELNLHEKQYEFLRTVSAHVVTLSVLEGHGLEEFPEFLRELPVLVAEFLFDHPRDVLDRFVAAQEKYAELL